MSQTLNESLNLRSRVNPKLGFKKHYSTLKSEKELSFAESKIADPRQQQYVYDLIPAKPFKAKLIYRATRDGWEPDVFHRLCDDKGRTVTFFKSDMDFVCAGYTSISWKSEGENKLDKEAFLASLTKSLAVYRPKDPNYAVSHNKEKGPNFSSALQILKDPILGEHRGWCYTRNKDSGKYNIPVDRQGNSVLTGDGADSGGACKYFTAVEVEVFLIT